MYLVWTQQPASRLRSNPQLHQPGPSSSPQALEVHHAPQSELVQSPELVQDVIWGTMPVAALTGGCSGTSVTLIADAGVCASCGVAEGAGGSSRLGG